MLNLFFFSDYFYVRQEHSLIFYHVILRWNSQKKPCCGQVFFTLRVSKCNIFLHKFTSIQRWKYDFCWKMRDFPFPGCLKNRKRKLLILWSQVDYDRTLWRTSPQKPAIAIREPVTRNGDPRSWTSNNIIWSRAMPKGTILVFSFPTEKNSGSLKYMKQHQWTLAIVEELLESNDPCVSRHFFRFFQRKLGWERSNFPDHVLELPVVAGFFHTKIIWIRNLDPPTLVVETLWWIIAAILKTLRKKHWEWQSLQGGLPQQVAVMNVMRNCHQQMNH